MSEAKLHHFVPQFYLRQWCDLQNRLWVYPIDGRPPFRASPRNFAAESKLYAIDPDAHGALRNTESWLSGWESRFANVWPDIVDRADNPRTRANIARFIATLVARHPRERDGVAKMNEWFIHAADGLSDEQHLT